MSHNILYTYSSICIYMMGFNSYTKKKLPMYESLFVVLDVIVEILIVPFYYICMYVILKDVFTDGNRQIQKETPTWNV